MALTWKYNAKKPGPPAGVAFAGHKGAPDDATEIHSFTWHDDGGGVLHRDLAEQANVLRQRADELDRQSKEALDQIVLPAGTGNEQVKEAIWSRAADLKRTLGIP